MHAFIYSLFSGDLSWIFFLWCCDVHDGLTYKCSDVTILAMSYFTRNVFGKYLPILYKNRSPGKSKQDIHLIFSVFIYSNIVERINKVLKKIGNRPKTAKSAPSPLFYFIKCLLRPFTRDSPPTLTPSLSIVWAPKFGHCRPTPILFFAPKPCIFYQNICILPRKIPINIQITYFRTWNSPTFRHFQLSAILFDFLQTNLDRFFWKIPTFYNF